LTKGSLRFIAGHQKAKRLCRECARRLDARQRWWTGSVTWAVVILALFFTSATVIRVTLGPLTIEGLFLGLMVALIPAFWAVCRGGLWR
jgi:hypothetical protein